MKRKAKIRPSSPDSVLRKKVTSLATSVREWIYREGLLVGESFQTWEQHFGPLARPWSDPVVLVLCADGPFANEVQGCGKSGRDVRNRFDRFLDQTEFCYDFLDSGRLIFHAHAEELVSRFYERELFFWRCRAILPAYADLDGELYEHVRAKPGRLLDMSPRLTAVFKNQGYTTHIGPGSGDDGVDIHLYQHDRISELVTLVQLKRYAIHRPIELEAVSALKATVDDQGANRGLFITTSRYSSTARKFADRYPHQLRLADTGHVVEWCAEVSARIARASSTEIPVQNGQLFSGLCNTRRGIYPRFAFVTKETAETLFYYEVEADRTPGGLVPLIRAGSVVPSSESGLAEKQVAVDGEVSFFEEVYGVEYRKWSGKPLQQLRWD